MTSRLVLVIGDLHIPDRALDIPAKASSLPKPKHIS
jgi:vacuolar protein sorting-associated protein 29